MSVPPERVQKMIPPFGKVTTAIAIENLIQALFDH
jgi:hypothetical protein